jgi:hypothetical protein
MPPYGRLDEANALNWAAIDAVSAELASRGHSGKRLWLNEWGYNTTDEALKARLVESVLTRLETPTYSNVFEANYLVLTDLPPGSRHDYGLCASDNSTLTITPRQSWYAFRDHPKRTSP